jgi:hypothetical protein
VDALRGVADPKPVTSTLGGGVSHTDAAVGCVWRVFEVFAWVGMWVGRSAVGLENVTASLEMQACTSAVGLEKCEIWISLCITRDAVCVGGKVDWQGVGRGARKC